MHVELICFLGIRQELRHSWHFSRQCEEQPAFPESPASTYELFALFGYLASHSSNVCVLTLQSPQIPDCIKVRIKIPKQIFIIRVCGGKLSTRPHLSWKLKATNAERLRKFRIEIISGILINNYKPLATILICFVVGTSAFSSALNIRL